MVRLSRRRYGRRGLASRRTRISQVLRAWARAHSRKKGRHSDHCIRPTRLARLLGWLGGRPRLARVCWRLMMISGVLLAILLIIAGVEPNPGWLPGEEVTDAQAAAAAQGLARVHAAQDLAVTHAVIKRHVQSRVRLKDANREDREDRGELQDITDRAVVEARAATLGLRLDAREDTLAKVLQDIAAEQVDRVQQPLANKIIADGTGKRHKDPSKALVAAASALGRTIKILAPDPIQSSTIAKPSPERVTAACNALRSYAPPAPQASGAGGGVVLLARLGGRFGSPRYARLHVTEGMPDAVERELLSHSATDMATLLRELGEHQGERTRVHHSARLSAGMNTNYKSMLVS